MAKKLRDEEMRFTVIVNGKEGQKAITDLERANRKLASANDTLLNKQKKLEKQGKQNTEAYKKLQTEIDDNTKSMSKNKDKMESLKKEMGLSELTMRQLKTTSKKLNKELEDLDPNDIGFNDLTKQLKAVNERMFELKGQTMATGSAIDELNKHAGALGDLATGLATGHLPTLQKGLRGVAGNIKGITKAALAFIATPIGLFIAALAGIALATKEFVNYNESIREAAILTQSITNLSGEALDDIRVRAGALEKTFNVDLKESLETAKSLVQNLGISYNEAFDIIEDGAVRGKTKNNEFLDSLKEYPIQFKNAGFSAKEFAAIVSTGIDLSIYSDKLPDAIKEFTLSVTEQTDAAKEAMINAFGKEFTDKLFKDLKNGAITPKDALASIATEAERIGLNSQQAQLLTADLFKGAGEDAGGALIVLKAVNIALNDQTKALTPLQSETKRLAAAELELAEAQDEALKSDSYITFSNDVSIAWKKVKTAFFNGVGFVVASFQKWSQALTIFLIQGEVTFRSIPLIVSKSIDIIAKSIGRAITNLSKLSDAFEALKRGDLSGIKNATIDFAKGIKNNFKETVKEINSLDTTIKDLREKVKEDFELKFTLKKQGAKDLAVKEELEKQLLERRKLQERLTEDEIKQAAASLLQKQEALKKLEENFQADRLNRLANTNLKKAQLNKASAIKQAVALGASQEFLKQIEEEHKILLAQAKKSDEEIELQRVTAFQQRKQQLLDEIEIAKEESDREKEKLKEEQNFEKEQAKLESDLKKLAITADEKEELEKLLLEKKRLSLDKINEKWNKKDLDRDKKLKDNLIKADKNLESAKKKALLAGVDLLGDIFGKKSGIYKALFALEKGLAIKNILVQTAKSIAQSKANLLIANAKALAFSPITFGQPWVSANTLLNTKETLTSKIIAGTQIAQIAATAIQGFEKGKYPIIRTDGKTFNSIIKPKAFTQTVTQPTYFQDSNILTGEGGPELIVDNPTFRSLRPEVIDEVYATRNRVHGFESGSFPQRTETTIPNQSNEELLELMSVMIVTQNRLNERLDNPIPNIAVYNDDEVQKIKQIQTEIEQARQGAIVGQ